MQRVAGGVKCSGYYFSALLGMCLFLKQFLKGFFRGLFVRQMMVAIPLFTGH